MRASPEYEAFERRWQLPVYFQLRWKEIVGALDTKTSNTAEWKLPLSLATWTALETCWRPDVFITELAPRFWRLSLQVKY